MKTKTNEPTVTKKFPIEVPVHTYGSGPAVYRVYFGKHYMIWKGKSLLQSVQELATNLERYMRLQKDIRTDILYHVARHCIRTRCTHATVDVIGSDYQPDYPDGPIDGYQVLVDEQSALWKAAKDPLCLNNNEWAWSSGWISQAHIQKWLAWCEKKAKK